MKTSWQNPDSKRFDTFELNLWAGWQFYSTFIKSFSSEMIFQEKLWCYRSCERPRVQVSSGLWVFHWEFVWIWADSCETRWREKPPNETETRLVDLRTKSCSQTGWEPANWLFLFCLRLQNSAQRDLWEIHQRGPGGHHGALRSRKVHPHEYPGWVQVGTGLQRPNSKGNVDQCFNVNITKRMW